MYVFYIKSLRYRMYKKRFLNFTPNTEREREKIVDEINIPCAFYALFDRKPLCVKCIFSALPLKKEIFFIF